ncbi:alpha/beta fold hydrolase [Beggiatoa leptomitoformis]|nr:alpha/beta hydrolase [Beggiatoa leptomitoformis]
MRNQHAFEAYLKLILLFGILHTTFIHAQEPQTLPAELKGLTMPGNLVSVGDHRLHIYCTGEGSPVVLMDAGLGGTFIDWSRIQPMVAQYTRVCTYDRAGYGWSESGTSPRTSSTIAEELFTLAKNAHLAPPYIVVGHSFGGFNVRLFASHHPAETVGMVLVDASHEKQFSRFAKETQQNLAPTTGAQIAFLSRPLIPNNLPADKQELAKRMLATERMYGSLLSEVSSMRTSAQEVFNASEITVPLVVISRGTQAWQNNPRGAQLEALWQELQDDLASHSPHSAHLIVHDSSHYIHLDKPQVVIESINSLVAIYRHERALQTELDRLSARWSSHPTKNVIALAIETN